MNPQITTRKELVGFLESIQRMIANEESIEGSFEYHPTETKDQFEVMAAIRTGAPGQGGVILIGVESITYKVWENGGNYNAMVEFCGPEAECKVCHGRGEYEGEFGPVGCQPCNSRLFAFIDHTGKRKYADDGDVIEKHADGLHLIAKHLHD